MIEQIKAKMAEEKTQRAVLNTVGLVVTYVATRVFAAKMTQGVELGINTLMAKMHPVVETTEEVK